MFLPVIGEVTVVDQGKFVSTLPILVPRNRNTNEHELSRIEVTDQVTLAVLGEYATTEPNSPEVLSRNGVFAWSGQHAATIVS